MLSLNKDKMFSYCISVPRVIILMLIVVSLGLIVLVLTSVNKLTNPLQINTMALYEL